MFITKNGKSQYIIKFKNTKVDIFNYDEILNLTEQALKKITNLDSLNGIYDIRVYTNYDYGIIMEIEKNYDEEETDIKIHFYIDSPILVKSDYFYLKDTNTKNKIVYYFDKEFYIEYNKDINEFSETVYGNKAKEIINKGIKILI